MHLKSLTLRGFKSFASTTVFEFDPAINAVVGPNGSGKSNVVDALNWVMGEQAAKSLRGGSMQDVIFAGTSSRSSLGRAKVTLVIDNSDSSLDVPATEVEISRTMFRSGGSEYELNGTVVRLSDVQDLLSDVGLGKSQHAVVGQGHIDRILHASSAQRRGFIEEAAGVLKYRRRAEKAERKLESMKANLDRLEDLEAELLSQLEPLGEQAETARTAREVQAQVRSLRSDVLASAAVELQEQQKIQDAAAATVREERRVAEKAVQVSLEQEASQKEGLEKVRAEIDAARQRRASLDKLISRVHSVSAVADERLRDKKEGSFADLAERLEKLEKDQRAEDQQLENWQSREEELVKSLADKKETVQQFSHLLVECEKELESLENQRKNHRQTVTELTDALATARSQVEKAEALKIERQDEVESASELLKDFSSILEEARNTELSRQTELADLEKSEKQVHEVRIKAARASEREQQKVAELQLVLESLKAQKSTLQDSLGDETPVEIPQGARRVYEALTIETGWEKAIARALGELAEAWMVEVDSMNAEYSRIYLTSSASPTDWAENQLPEKYLPALSVLQGDSNLLTTLASALSRVALVENQITRTDYEKELDQYPNLVLVACDGSMHTPAATLYSSSGTRSSVEISALLGDVQKKIATTQAELAEAEKTLETAAQEHQSAREQEKTLARAVGSARASLATATAELSALKTRGESAQNELKRLTKKLKAATSHEEELKKALEQAVHNLDEAVEEKPSESVNQLKSKNEELKNQLAQAKTELATVEVLAENARQQVEYFERQSKSLSDQAEQLKQQKAEQQQAQARQEQLQVRAQSIKERAQLLEKALQTELRATQELEEKASSNQRELVDAGEAAHDERAQLRKNLEELTNKLGELGIKRAKLETQRENLEERATEELSADLEDLLENFAQRAEPFDRQTAETELINAQKQLQKLGTVNPLALEEYSALEERHAYLKEQIADLKRSRSDMRALMKELNQHIKTEFTQAFEETREQFERIFAQLFPGGEGTLVLTDPNDALETGIDIQARPAGKKVKRLSLLSGGERALASLALLTAIFAARPSPFYVLDEVEAALDDRNLSRILEVFKELAQKSQLIIVTHKPRTVEIAEALYGVSMVDGVSQVISQSAAELKKIL